MQSSRERGPCLAAGGAQTVWRGSLAGVRTARFDGKTAAPLGGVPVLTYPAFLYPTLGHPVLLHLSL